MPPESSEQESYSLDEMLERLRDGEREKREAENSEVVTRPDGSKVRRVRKRKRRSDQPVAEGGRRRPSRRALLVLLVVAVVLLAVAAVGALLRVAKFNSEGYQKELEQSLAASLDADLSLQRMSVTPANARVERVSLRWQDGALVESALFEKVKAPLGLGGFVQGRWSGVEVVAEKGSVRVVNPVALSKSRSGEMPLGHERFRCEQTRVNFGHEKDPIFRIESSGMTVTKGAGGATQVIMRGGRAFLKGCDPLDLEIGTARITGNELKLTALRLRERNGKGAIEVSGLEDVRPGVDGVLVFRLSQMPLAPLLGRDVGEVFNVVANNSGGRIEIDTTGRKPVEFRIPVQGAEAAATLRGFPFLLSLKTMLGHTDYGTPVFDEYSLVAHRVGEQVRLEQLNLSMRNVLMIRGELAFGPGDAVSGLLRVGVPERRMITPTSKKKWESFEKGEEGMYWIDIAVGGTLDRLEDDLEETLRKAALGLGE